MNQALARLAPRERAAALSAALGVTDGEQAAGLAADLLASPPECLDAAAIAAAAGNWDRLDLRSRARLLAAGRGRWGGVVQRLVSDRRPGPRLALIRMAAETAHPAFTGALPGLMGDLDSAVAAAAGERLLALCAGPWNPEVDAAAARAFESFAEHRRPAAILAVALLAGQAGGVRGGTDIARVVADHELAGHSALRRLIRRGGAVGPEQVWLWLRHPAWAGACVERLASEGDPDAGMMLLDAMLGRAHLAEHPLRRRHLARARGETDGRGATGFVVGVDEPGWRVAAAARLLVAAGARAGELDRWAAPLLLHSSAAARAGIGRAAASMVGRPAVLLDLCFDADERTAHSALLTLRPWRRIGYLPDHEVDRAVRAAARSVHPRVRALAAGLRIGPEGWVAAGDGAARGRLSARAALAADRAGAQAHIRARLLGPAADACGALSLLAYLGMVEEFEEQVLDLLHAPADDRLRATAAATLGRAASARSRRELERLVLGDTDPRVRANALEAMTRRARRDPTAAGRVGALAAEVQRTDAHRLRGSALRAELLERPDDPAATAALGAMLADSRPMHRAAALWLAERAAPGSASGGWGQIAARIAELACSDADPAVRARAERCSRAVMARLRSAWTVRVRHLGAVGAVA